MERSDQLSMPTWVHNVACDFDALFTGYYRRLTRLLYRATAEAVPGSAAGNEEGKIIGRKAEGGKLIGGLYTTSGDEIVMKDMKGEQGQIEESCAGEGKYKWRFDGKALRLTRISDHCDERQGL